MKRVTFLLMVASLLLMPMMAFAHTESDPYVTDLIAGGGNDKSAIDVGDVLVWNDANTLYVKYVVTEGDWCLTETHLAIGDELSDIPQTKKNSPIPGLFEYNDAHDCITEFTYEVPLAWDFESELFIAAHAIVLNQGNIIGYTDEIIGYTDEIIGWDCPTLDALAAMLPESVGIKAVNYPNANAYFDLEVTGDLAGTFPTWCIDETHTISLNTNYTANLYSSFEPIPEYLTTGTDPNIDHPENLDLVNWVVNNSDGYTSAEVQNVIWNLIDDNPPALSAHEQDLYDAALANGEGFVPDFAAGDVFTVVVAPVTEAGYQATLAQVTLSELGVECTPIYKPIYQPIYQTETGWGAGIDFNTKDWSMYFNYTVQNEVCGTVLAPIDGQQVIIAQTLYSDLGDLDISGTVYIKVTYPVAGGPAYFPTIYIDVDKDGTWDYEYPGWCVDTENVIYQNTVYEAMVYTCGDDLTGVVDNPENKPIADHILAQDWVGQTASCDGAVFTYGDVQRAIWTVIDDAVSTAGLGTWTQCHVDEILADAGW